VTTGRIYLVIGVLCLLWGSTWVVIRGSLEHLPPLTSAAARFALAALVMTVLAPALARREPGIQPTAPQFLTLGFLNFASSYAIVYHAELILPSGLVSVLWGVFPILTAVAGHLFLEEKLGKRQALGFLIGFGGVATLFITDVRNIGAEAVVAGAVLLLSPIVSIVGITYVKRTASAVSSALLNRNAMWVGAMTLCVGAWVRERDVEIVFNLSAAFSTLYLALGGTVATFGLYFWALRHAPAGKLSLVAYITPVIAVWLGWLVYDEPITPTLMLGTALIIGGVFLAGKSSRAPD